MVGGMLGCVRVSGGHSGATVFSSLPCFHLWFAMGVCHFVQSTTKA